ncbi:GGDEF domain-containing protein [Sphingomonas bacterium]|uniref:GGDEF domain-containing protein n=1 Tax=Sphingomonas bacterium TaxID=1895847 RepID=UPI0015773117|nr:GGDEF domain-containing protein [Sphingomonas bacterium]
MIAAKLPVVAPTSNDLFRRIGAFLAEHRLSPEPGHYAFAYQVLHDADGPLGRAVARLTDGGVRLTGQQIEALGGTVAGVSQPLEPEGDAVDDAALVARTRLQVEDFAAMVRRARDEARGFGIDLAASAEAIRRTGDPSGIADMVELTGLMVRRVRLSEGRLQRATEEAQDLRARLEEAQGSARRDPLTNLPNRRAFEEAFAALDPAVPASLAICDIDRFKQVNDTFGHAVGDRVLTAIGQTLATHCAPHLVARYGGEEFVMLFTGGSDTAAHALLDGARAVVSARRFRSRETGEPIGAITFSAGVGCIAPGETLDGALHRVDRALYEAKEQGRARVVLAHG